MLHFIKSRAHLLVAVGLLLITLAVNISMPLFRAYAAASGFGNGQTSLVFAAYVLGMLPCYVFLGGISDRWGRKRVLLLAVVIAFCATLVITIWPNVWALAIARFLQGVGVGIGMSAGTAYISELLKEHPLAAYRAAGLASLFTALGFGGGAIATTLVLLFHYSLSPVSYWLLLLLTAIAGSLLFFLPKLPPIGGKLLRLPYFPKGSLVPNVAIGICWAATGVVIAIIPTQLTAMGLAPYAGFCLVLINWSGAFLQPFIRKLNPSYSVQIGLYLIPVGFAAVIAGCMLGWLLLILFGTFIIGLAAYGFSYLGGLAIVAEKGGVQKARAVSGYMFIGYIGFGIPAVLLGYLADQFGIIQALTIFELAVVVLSGWMLWQLKKNK
ncbi:MAG: hypothetical protein RLY16_2210 [Bacteroidota bacterium]|jgi:MFS family permease